MNKQIDMTGVVIKTERLTLRPWKEEDQDDMYEYARVDGVGQMAGWKPHESKEETRAIIAEFIAKKRVLALEYEGKVIGSLGIERYREDLYPALQPYLGREIGYVLSKDYWGRGLMPEAVQAVKEYLFQEEGLDFITVGHFDWNRQSARVIQKNGFQYYATMPYETHVDTVETDFEYILFHPKHEKPLIHVPRIGILCAADDELNPFLARMESLTERKKAGMSFYHGTLEGIATTAVFCGACKVNAAAATQLLIDTYGCDFIINSGTCGGMGKDVQVMDTIVSAEVAYHDVAEGILTEYPPYLKSVWMAADERLLRAAKVAAEKLDGNILFGQTVTGEAFIEGHNRAAIEENFAPLSVDMETAAAAQVCHMFETPFLAIRTVTDLPGKTVDTAFYDNIRQASERSVRLTLRTLHEMKRQSSL